jgi:hypothetical protein
MEPKRYQKGKHLRTDFGHGVKEFRKVNEPPPQPPAQPPTLEIEVDETVAKGQYANLAGISHGETEFLLDFLFLAPGQRKAKVHTRVISSPAHTKRFAAALAENIRRYEERFGPIRMLQPNQPPQSQEPQA